MVWAEMQWPGCSGTIPCAESALRKAISLLVLHHQLFTLLLGCSSASPKTLREEARRGLLAPPPTMASTGMGSLALLQGEEAGGMLI